MLVKLSLLALLLLVVHAYLPRISFPRGMGLLKPGFNKDELSVPQVAQNVQSKQGVRSMRPLRDILGLGPAEIAITLVVGLVLFGPETLKSLSKDVGKAAAELKEIPKTFKEGMEEGAETSQVAKMKAIAAEKKAKRDKKSKAKEDDEDDEDDDDDDDDEDDDDDDE